jgi:hypothetical protein
VGGARAATILLQRQRSSISDAPSTTLRVVPLPRFAGADKAVPFSRRDFSPEPSTHRFQIPAPHDLGGFSLLPFAALAKGSGTPTDADDHPPHLAMRLVPRRGTIACRRPTAALAEGTYVTQGATQAMLPGTRSERVLPAFACPSPVSTSRADRSIGRHDARAGRGTGRILPPAATAPAPHSRIPSRKASLNERVGRM